jgi:beta-lactamase regulating signal transducer with metallopeptidase domain
MLAWMTYIIVVSALLSAAALAAEYMARLRQSRSRWIWIATIVASLVIPALIASVSIELPSLTAAPQPVKALPLRVVTSAYLSPTVWIDAALPKQTQWRDHDALLKRVWLGMSVALLFALALSAIALFVRKRSWQLTTVQGQSLYVAPNVGPAVVGLLRPCIVIPHWVIKSSDSVRSMVLAHERSHIEAHDQRLLTIALCLLVFMPWNVPLWWQLRRLRYAIEVDCDTRVLKSGHAVEEYGETLIEVGQRRSAYVGAVAAMSESVSFLERRIALMTRNPIKWWRVATLGLSTLCLACVALAAQVSPPNAQVKTEAPPAAATDRQVATVDPAIYDRYVGEYALSDNTILSVRRDGSRLLAKLSQQPEFEIYPSSETEFFWKVVDAQVKFLTDGNGPAEALVLHQFNTDMHAPRVENGTAARVAAAVEAKKQSQAATPGSDTALKHFIEAAATGSPDYAQLSPALANVLKPQAPVLQAHLSQLGPIQSIEFQGVGNQGWDSYQVRHANGVSLWHITVDQNGKIGGILLVPTP